MITRYRVIFSYLCSTWNPSQIKSGYPQFLLFLINYFFLLPEVLREGGGQAPCLAAKQHCGMEGGMSCVWFTALTYQLAELTEVLLIGKHPETSGRKPAHTDAFALEILENFHKCLTSFAERGQCGNLK